MIRVQRTRRLAGAAIIVMAAFVSSRLSGLLRDAAIGYRFGTSPELAAYYAANRVQDVIFQVVAGAAVASAFIPVYSAYLARDTPEKGWEMLSIFLTFSVVIFLPLAFLGMAVVPWIMPLLVPQFPPAYQELAAQLARIVLIAPLFFALGCFATSVLNAHGRFFLAALAPTCYNLGILIGAVLLARWLGIYGLALGALIGSILFLAVQLPGLRQIGAVIRPRLDLRHEGVRAVVQLMGPRALGLAVTQVNFLVTLNLASSVPAWIPSLNFAWMLTMLPLGVFAMAISTAVFPALAEHGAAQQSDELRDTLVSAARFILYLTIPASIGLIVLGQPIVRVLYQRGEFTPESTALTARALRLYALGLLGMAVTEIVTRAFYALHDTLTPVKVGALALIVNVGLAVALVRPLGLEGLALATAAASTVEGGLLFLLARRRIPGLDPRLLVPSAAKSLAAGLLMGAGVMAFTGLTAPLSSSLGGVPVVAGAVILGAVIYLGVTIALRSDEAHLLRQAISRQVSGTS
ncbi:MAG: murein biosynthesis integral membrane protein MurJ [Chloroflexi bacterium]|nr:murein biosynthesis integral membrane protein MurJ [Chloroflexota bacterium]